jgi:glycosyltransferase involved in cell wall biosynthesis
MSASIAVIIPARDAADTVDRSLESVLAQTSPADEIILIDDGSRDDTAARAARHGTRITVLRQAGAGCAAARKTGTEHASAEYLAHLDADDWWPTDHLARYREVLDEERVEFLAADLQRAEPDDPPSAYLPRNSSLFPWVASYLARNARTTGISTLHRLAPEDALELLLRGYPLYPSTTLVRRRAILDAGGWDPDIDRCQDFDMWLRLVRRVPLHYLDEVQAIVGLHRANRARVPYIIGQAQGDLAVLRKQHTVERKPHHRRRLARAIANRLCGLGYWQRHAGDTPAARAAYGEALRWPGRRLHAFARWAWLRALP